MEFVCGVGAFRGADCVQIAGGMEGDMRDMRNVGDGRGRKAGRMNEGWRKDGRRMKKKEELGV